MNILAIRFTAVGDLVISLPYLIDLLEKRADFHIYLATKEQMKTFLPAHPRLHPCFLTLEDQKAGLWGLLKFFFRSRKHQIDVVADLHNNIRSNILLRLFQLTGAKVFQMDKIRYLRNQNTRRKNKVRTLLPYIGHQYKTVLEHSSWTTLEKYPRIDISDYYPSGYELSEEFRDKILVGIAPFAARETKIFPLHLMQAAIEEVMQDERYVLFLFGAGSKEREVLDSWAVLFPGRSIKSYDLGGFNNEIAVMKKLDIMVCMDSANLHFATLAGTQTLSIWGSTHADLGFAPPLSEIHHRLEIDVETLPCRPCSVFGNKPCYRGDHACMEWITSDRLAGKIKELTSARK